MNGMKKRPGVRLLKKDKNDKVVMGEGRTLPSTSAILIYEVVLTVYSR